MKTKSVLLTVLAAAVGACLWKAQSGSKNDRCQAEAWVLLNGQDGRPAADRLRDYEAWRKRWRADAYYQPSGPLIRFWNSKTLGTPDERWVWSTPLAEDPNGVELQQKATAIWRFWEER